MARSNNANASRNANKKSASGAARRNTSVAKAKSASIKSKKTATKTKVPQEGVTKKAIKKPAATTAFNKKTRGADREEPYDKNPFFHERKGAANQKSALIAAQDGTHQHVTLSISGDGVNAEPIVGYEGYHTVIEIISRKPFSIHETQLLSGFHSDGLTLVVNKHAGFPFMRLPKEIMNMIIAVIIDQGDVCVYPTGKTRNTRDTVGPALLKVKNRFLRSLVAPMFYGTRSFYFHEAEGALKFFDSVGPHATHIRNIKIGVMSGKQTGKLFDKLMSGDCKMTTESVVDEIDLRALIHSATWAIAGKGVTEENFNAVMRTIVIGTCERCQSGQPGAYNCFCLHWQEIRERFSTRMTAWFEEQKTWLTTKEGNKLRIDMKM
ncbi:hypothetical protein BDZ85DRAFT_286483 [Elsinoe ampelina]|uniref:Uncharacterized protein n=1 Tax=Elsinoe ampelina TaxID=302913 RepID=A0A6A6FXS6_9PEZI|nr:hypothetical protein BDZ85DRAFT_286483 [Elsinoe ampelina]